MGSFCLSPTTTGLSSNLLLQEPCKDICHQLDQCFKHNDNTQITKVVQLFSLPTNASGQTSPMLLLRKPLSVTTTSFQPMHINNILGSMPAWQLVCSSTKTKTGSEPMSKNTMKQHHQSTFGSTIPTASSNLNHLPQFFHISHFKESCCWMRNICRSRNHKSEGRLGGKTKGFLWEHGFMTTTKMSNDTIQSMLHTTLMGLSWQKQAWNI